MTPADIDRRFGLLLFWTGMRLSRSDRMPMPEMRLAAYQNALWSELERMRREDPVRAETSALWARVSAAYARLAFDSNAAL